MELPRGTSEVTQLLVMMGPFEKEMEKLGPLLSEKETCSQNSAYSRRSVAGLPRPLQTSQGKSSSVESGWPSLSLEQLWSSVFMSIK